MSGSQHGSVRVACVNIDISIPVFSYRLSEDTAKTTEFGTETMSRVINQLFGGLDD